MNIFTEENNFKQEKKTCGWNRLAIRGEEEASKTIFRKHKCKKFL